MPDLLRCGVSFLTPSLLPDALCVHSPTTAFRAAESPILSHSGTCDQGVYPFDCLNANHAAFDQNGGQDGLVLAPNRPMVGLLEHSGPSGYGRVSGWCRRDEVEECPTWGFLGMKRSTHYSHMNDSMHSVLEWVEGFPSPMSFSVGCLHTCSFLREKNDHRTDICHDLGQGVASYHRGQTGMRHHVQRHMVCWSLKDACSFRSGGRTTVIGSRSRNECLRLANSCICRRLHPYCSWSVCFSRDALRGEIVAMQVTEM
ncbi:hypothetical protein GALMADRAFT_665111 [Galerina marginata CBS 339.88]|uniref:Uncharacterized protein n=1 Tax=Galerina marginata (strain CBS 339.88) TaxID=685588 RepID=A0A067TMZ4_GALM3|nr:hypothetical protein GALMADRAFT_665111 [Galerina marginata CBS 339.88]